MKRWFAIAMMACCGAVCAAEAKDDDGMAAAREALLAPAPKAEQTVALRDTKITAKHMEYNAQEGVAILTDEVVVDDARFKLTADKLFVFTAGENQLDRLVVMGNVEVDSEGRHASCDRAVYTEADGRLVMVGNAKLVSQADGQARTVMGDKITIWTNEERIEVYPNPTLTFPADSAKGLGGLGK